MKSVVIASMSVLLATSAMAKPAAKAAAPAAANTAAPALETLDADHDGKFSKAEVASHKDLTDNFDKLDANKDGSIDSTEMKAHKAAAPHAHGK